MADALAEGLELKEEALLLPTSVGPIAAVLTLPDSAPIAGVFVLEGSGGSRSGTNQLWVRLARSLSADGIATLRTDYAGVAESWDADPHEMVAASRDVGRWFEEQLDGVGILLVAQCFGLTPAHALCRDGGNVLGVALVVPSVYDAAPSASGRSLRRTLRRVSGYVRYWRAWRRTRQSEYVDGQEALKAIVQRVPTRVVMGSLDNCYASIKALEPDLHQLGSIELEVANGQRLNGAKNQATQSLILDGVAAWVRQCVGAADART